MPKSSRGGKRTISNSQGQKITIKNEKDVWSERHIIAFRGRRTENSNSKLWDFRGEKERVDKLVNSINNTRGMKSLSNLALSLKKEDEHITTLIKQVEKGQESGDTKVLMSLRRQIRQAQKRVKDKRGM